MVSKYQKFQAVEINRQQIRNAPYNPRHIDVHARKKLKAKIKKTGLVETLVWNERTGNLVSGHQRIGILDELEGNNTYSLTVAKISVPEKTEKELNIFLNNTSAQGQYDFAALEKLLLDGGLDINEIGFDMSELNALCDSESLSGLMSSEKDQAKDDIEQLQKFKQAKEKHKKSYAKKDDSDYYVVVVFQSQQELDTFLEKTQLPVDGRFIDGHRIAEKVGVDLCQ